MGCGWLGKPLAVALSERGFQVRGSTTSSDKMDALKNAGILPFQLLVSESGIQGPVDDFLEKVDILILNIPPGLRKAPGENYVTKMKAVHKAVNRAGIDKLVFVSSTSVYGKTRGKVTERTKPLPDTESGVQILASEKLFHKDHNLQTIVLRFGGLIGPGRHPVQFLSGKNALKNGNERINLIHLQDCIHIITKVVEGGHWNEIFNGVYPAHPFKRDYYTKMALKRHLTPPNFSEQSEGMGQKFVISSNFLTKKYSFFTSIFE